MRPKLSHVAPVVLLLLTHGCGEKADPVEATEAIPLVRYRVGEPSTEAGRLFVDSVPGARWDRGLATAAQELLSLSTSRTSVIDPVTSSLVASRAGFPGQARFARVLNGGAPPLQLVDAVASEGSEAVDVALAQRTYGDGTVLWIVAWAPHTAELDPLPRQVELDAPLPVHVELQRPGGTARLFVATPAGPVEELSMTPGVTRWVDLFHLPGEYRLEVVQETRDGEGEVALLFSVFADQEPPRPGMLAEPGPEAADPHQAEQVLYEALDALRAEHGLGPVARFERFEGVVREHSALMAGSGTVAHRIPGLTEGVASRAAAVAHPRAHHFESVATARSAEDALAVIADSPGHLRTLLCEPCTHAAIGAALEPVLDRPPRLFVTIELLSFPQGEPRPIQQWNRE